MCGGIAEDIVQNTGDDFGIGGQGRSGKLRFRDKGLVKPFAEHGCCTEEFLLQLSGADEGRDSPDAVRRRKGIHVLYVVFHAGKVFFHYCGLLLQIFGRQAACGQLLEFQVALDYGERRAHIVGKGGVNALFFFRLAPQKTVIIFQGKAHAFHAAAKLAHFIVAVIGKAEIQILPADSGGSLLDQPYRFLQLAFIEETGGGSQTEGGIEADYERGGQRIVFSRKELKQACCCQA